MIRTSLRHPGFVSCQTASRALLCAAALLMCATDAWAESDSTDPARPGWYAGINIFYAISDYELSTNDLGVVPPEPSGADPKFSNAFGVDARLGYRAFEHWAFEFDYQWQAGYDSKNGQIQPDLEIDTHHLSLNTKYFLLTDRIQPYGLLGASLLIFNTEIVNSRFRKPWEIEVGFAPRFAAGIDYHVSERWVLNLEGSYIVPVGVLDGANMGSAGVGAQYRF